MNLAPSRRPSLARRDDDGLWAITSYFNPMRYRRRRANYQIFRECLRVPLLVIELAYGPDFELSEADADILVQVRDGDILWQKERLLDIGLRRLPNRCRNVAWLDCDIIFESDNWAERVNRLLDSCMIAQLYREVHYLPRDWMPGEAKHATLKRPSMASGVASGKPAPVCLSEWKDREYTVYSMGLAWAARRKLLDQHGFYDACILGGGDRAMVCAIYGCFDHIIDLHHMNDQEVRRYLCWGKPFQQMVGGAVSFADGIVFHLWHGEMRDRRLGQRYPGLSVFQFDPYEDITGDHNGPLRWNTPKYEMHKYVRNYFSLRNEDG